MAYPYTRVIESDIQRGEASEAIKTYIMPQNAGICPKTDLLWLPQGFPGVALWRENVFHTLPHMLGFIGIFMEDWGHCYILIDLNSAVETSKKL